MIRTLLTTAAFGLAATSAFAETYTVTVTNNLDEELLAPILIADVKYDTEIFDMGYVTPEAEHQILTGDPAQLAARIGPDAMVGHGNDGPPGVLLAAGSSVSFEITTEAKTLRVISMVAPTVVPDNYVTGTVDLGAEGMASLTLERFDLGHDEGTKTIKSVAAAAATIEFHAQMHDMEKMEKMDSMTDADTMDKMEAKDAMATHDGDAAMDKMGKKDTMK